MPPSAVVAAPAAPAVSAAVGAPVVTSTTGAGVVLTASAGLPGKPKGPVAGVASTT